MITYTKLNILSYNIWADKKDRQQRLDQLCSNITADQPDIILLQEVSNATVLDIINTLKLCSYNYKISNDNNRPIFELLASKKPFTSFKFSRYSNSPTSKGVLWADINLGSNSVTIMTTQLEQNNSRKTQSQLRCLLDFASQKDNIVIACDIGSLEKIYIGEEWQDAWLAGGQNKLAQYTIDPDRNKYIDGDYRYRSDRVLLKGEFSNINYSLVDTGPNEPLVSAHFGLKLTVQLSLGLLQ